MFYHTVGTGIKPQNSIPNVLVKCTG